LVETRIPTTNDQWANASRIGFLIPSAGENKVGIRTTILPASLSFVQPIELAETITDSLKAQDGNSEMYIKE
jgi:hypothetical protein